MMNNEPIVIEYVLNAPVERVWQAITNKNDMKIWYFDLAAFSAELDFKFTFEGGTEENKYLHLCTVTEVIPHQILTYSWRYDGYAGNSFVTFELFAEDGLTRLKLTHAGLETFPQNPDFDKANFAEGWNYIIGKSLAEFVDLNQ